VGRRKVTANLMELLESGLPYVERRITFWIQRNKGTLDSSYKRCKLDLPVELMKQIDESIEKTGKVFMVQTPVGLLLTSDKLVKAADELLAKHFGKKMTVIDG